MADHMPAFYMGFRLAEIDLDCGTITRAFYDRAPGGAFGKVFFGRWRGLDVAVKILASKSDVAPDDAASAFRVEVQNMLKVRSTIERARVLKRVGAELSEPCDLPDVARRCSQLHGLGGWANAAVVFGVGTEPDLAAAATGLPPGPAHLIVMERLTGGTLEAPPAHVDERVRVAAGLAGGLSLLAAAHVVHADLKVWQEETMWLHTLSSRLSFTVSAGRQRHASYAWRRRRSDRLRRGPHRQCRRRRCNVHW
jgi:hypothetical protein